MPRMTKPLFQTLTTGLLVSGTAVGLNVLNVLSPVELLNLTQLGHDQPQMAIAQTDVEEAIRVRVYREASPAVVSIETPDSTGSGSIIREDGLILTNAHVVAGASTVKVILADGTELTGDVIAFADGGLDLAAVKVHGQTNLPTIPIANPNSVEVGQSAFAIGNPFGQFQNTFTVGIVSRIDRDRGLIQTDAAINPGNSGGPLINSKGELIGVNTSIFTTGDGGNIGLGFAISIDQVEPFLVAIAEGRAATTAQQFPNSGGRPPEQIALNSQPVEGQLDNGSSVLPFDNSFYNTYQFEGQAGQQVIIEMVSQDIDAYLILLDPNGRELSQDDDGGGGTNARIIVSLPENGTYTLLANSYGPGEAGLYTLRVGEVGPTAPSRSTATAPTSVLLREQGVLGRGSQVLAEDGSYYDEYSFEGQTGQTVTISLESNEFDPYLIVLTPDGQLLAQNDDANARTTNSQIRVTLPMSGTYTIYANSYDSTGRGQYTLTVQ